jgi:hypothetical protein
VSLRNIISVLVPYGMIKEDVTSLKHAVLVKQQIALPWIFIYVLGHVIMKS